MNWKEVMELARKMKRNEDGDIATTILGVFLGFAFIVILGISLIAYIIWAHAYAIQHMWQWLICTTFGLKPITWAQAWGFGLIVSYLTHVHNSWKGKDERESHVKIAEFIVLILKPWIALGIAYICAHYFMKAI